MAFQIKNFVSIAASMINYAKTTQNRISDFTIGSVFRTIVEASAVEIEELYQQMWLGLKEGIPVALYQAFDFNKQPESPSQGVVTVTITAGAAFTLPAGTAFIAAFNNSTYNSIAAANVALNQTVFEVTVSENKINLNNPVPINTNFTVNIPRLVSAIAKAEFSRGKNTETEAMRKQRFITFVQNLARSTTAGLEYGLLTCALKDVNGEITEQVKQAKVVEWFLQPPANGVYALHGVVNCYIHNGAGGASSELIALCQDVINGYIDGNGQKIVGYKSAGVQVIIEASTNHAVDISAVVITAENANRTAILTAVDNAITAYLADLNIGEKILFAEITTAAMNVPGVINFTLTNPSADYPVALSQKAVKGTYAFT